MNRIYFLILITAMFINPAWGQEERGLVRSGNKQYKSEKYSDAEVDYRKAIEKQPSSGVANYNLGNALYKQEKYPEAAEQYSKATDGGLDKKELAKVYHNIGNSMLQSQKFQEGVDAYKKALKYNPNDIDTKYNLAYAQRMLKSQPPQNKDNKDDKNKDNKDKKDQDKKDQDKKNDKQDQDKKPQDQKQDEKQQQQQPQAGKISKEDAKRMLQAIQNDENNTQDKLKKEKAQAQKYRPAVDW
jgi:Ca-activated chloride channel family protein